MVQDPLTGPLTLYADDHLGVWSFHTKQDILDMERDVLKFFLIRSEAGMRVNPSKSKLIMKVKGAEAERYLANFYPWSETLALWGGQGPGGKCPSFQNSYIWGR